MVDIWKAEEQVSASDFKVLGRGGVLPSTGTSSGASPVGGDMETRSWVARAEPRNRLWGITVAPSMPTDVYRPPDLNKVFDGK